MQNRDTAVLEKVHDPKTNRLDAKGVAALYGVGPTAFARMIDEPVSLIKTRPASPKLQRKLKALVLAYDGLAEIFPAEHIPKWMRHPARRLGGLTPLEHLEHNGVASFEALVDEILGGGYS